MLSPIPAVNPHGTAVAGTAVPVLAPQPGQYDDSSGISVPQPGQKMGIPCFYHSFPIVLVAAVFAGLINLQSSFERWQVDRRYAFAAWSRIAGSNQNDTVL